MTIYLDTYDSPTGLRLLNQGGFTRWSEGSRPSAGDTILRWGRGIGGYPERIKVLNPVICSDKLHQGQRIALAGIPIPKIYTSADEWRRDGYPDLVKKPREGECGRGIVLCQRGNNLPGWLYQNIYMLFIDKMREFRAVQVGDLTAYIMEKFPPEGTNPLCWNLHKGATWHRLSSSETALSRKINNLATQTVNAIRYDFGAVDLIMDHERKLYVLECNSRPGLGPENIVLFINVLKTYCER